MDELAFPELLDQFRQELHDCRELYRSSGQTCVEAHVERLSGSERDFVSWMDDLHKALLIKTFVTICEADRRWSRNEQRLAQELFLHAWGRQLEGEALRAAVRHVARQSLELKWYSLVRPFDQIALLRERVGELETITTRLANTIARADGQLVPATAACVRYLTDELRRHLRPIPVDEPSQHTQADSLGSQAIRRVEREASKARTKCQLDEASPPAAAQASPHERLTEALAELEGLIGLSGVKNEVRTLVNFLKVQEQRHKAGLPQTSLSLHMVFHGNPGTGKTTIARIVARIYGAMGILDKGHLIETDRSGLVAQYAGQTAVKTNKKVDEAMGGILFIDEAYSLVAEGSDDPYGSEAVQALLKRMEDDRARIVVILAGYPAPMARLLGSNPGLSSRFSRHLTFADYTAGELGQIFHRMCLKNQYVVPPAARAKLLFGLQWLYDRRDEHFGNGRTVRNLFELSIRRLANRIANISRLSRDQLTVLEPDDIHLTDVPPDQLADLTESQLQFRISCPDCQSQCPVPQGYLGRRVKCNQCQHEFVAEWGEPVLAESGTT